MSEHKCQNTKQGLYLVLEAEQEASYPDSGPVMDSKDGGPEVESSDSELEGLGGISK